MIYLELTEEDAQQLMLFIDLALRAQGVRLAAQAAAMAAKLEAAHAANRNGPKIKKPKEKNHDST